MSAVTPCLPLRPNYHKLPTDSLIAARESLNEVLDARARQASLFAAAKPLPGFVAAPESVPDVLSPSSVTQFMDCSARWYYRKMLQLPETRTAALGLGSAVHAAVAHNFRQKIETGQDLSVDELGPVYREAFAEQFDTVVLGPDDNAHDLLECGEVMLRVYMEQAAPAIKPAAVELAVEGLVGGVKAHGFVDVLDVNGCVIDLKTAAKKPSGISASHRLQVATYSMITPGASGIARRDVLTKTKTVGHSVNTFEITPADRKLTERLYSITLDQMRSGLVVPNRASFLCSRKNCSFWQQCQADYGGEVSD